MYKISIIGIGFVGSAIKKSLDIKSINKQIEIYCYDKYKNNGIGNINECLNYDILFLCLPTLYDNNLGEYDKENIYEICDFLYSKKFNGLVVIKSTIEPETIDKISEKYNNLNFVHNPEFLSAKTAFEDFHNQKHIVLGKGKYCSNEKFDYLKNFYSEFYPEAEISVCNSLESESMKIFCNSFYAVKVQFFTELYLICKKNEISFDIVRDMMLKNNWINPMHTIVPGTDGKISYGGLCFPKDTNALLKYMNKKEIPNKVLESTILERNNMRDDNINIK